MSVICKGPAFIICPGPHFLGGPAVWLYANCALLYTSIKSEEDCLKLQQDLATHA